MQDNQPEDELIALAQSGAPEAFDALVRRYQEFIVNFVYRITNDREAALDVAQDSFVKAFKSLKTFQGSSSFRTWLAAISLNTARSYLKKNKLSVTSSSLQDFESGTPNPEESFQKNQRKEKVRKALIKLKPDLQEVIRLCAIEGFSYAEAAQALNIPLGTVCSRMNAALSELRIILSKENSHD